MKENHDSLSVEITISYAYSNKALSSLSEVVDEYYPILGLGDFLNSSNFCTSFLIILGNIL